MPKGKKTARRDDTDFTQYAEGGKVKSKVNAAGNYTKPDLRKRIFNSVKAAAIVGTGAGQWSARKSQVLAKRYKAAGGGYRD
jgi:putative N-acetylmannosamine-6-phosphate epimerase